MARPLRIEYPGAVYHITSRGNEKKTIFKDDQDRNSFLDTIQQVNKRYNWICHAYCLMGNHYHLLIETSEGNLSIGMRQVNGLYTQRFNKRHRRVGHLFQGRYKAILIQKDSHLLEVARYIILNPIRAYITKQPDEWNWSSYPATAGMQTPHPCLTIQWILSQFSTNRSTAEKEYCEFVMEGMGKETIWKEAKGQCILGQEGFAERLTPYIRGHEKIPEISKGQRYASRPGLEKIFTKNIYGDKDKRDRDKMIGEAVYRYGYKQKQIADHLGMHFTSISRILNKRGGLLKK